LDKNKISLNPSLLRDLVFSMPIITTSFDSAKNQFYKVFRPEFSVGIFCRTVNKLENLIRGSITVQKVPFKSLGQNRFIKSTPSIPRPEQSRHLNHVVLLVQPFQRLALGQLEQRDLGRHEPPEQVAEDRVVAERNDVLRSSPFCENRFGRNLRAKPNFGYN
jgi:hypothetical protein